MDTLVNTPKQSFFTLHHKGISPAAFPATVAAGNKDSQGRAPIRTWPVAPVKGANHSLRSWRDAPVALGGWVSSQAVGTAALRHPTEPSLGGQAHTCGLLLALPTAGSPQHHYI